MSKAVSFDRHIIDCDATPHSPEGLTIVEHKKGGQLRWNPANFKLWLHPKQKNGVVGAHILREWAKDKPVYNACVLDYWLAHPEIIPAECRGKGTCFWGTIYRGWAGRLYVRRLVWDLRFDEHPVPDYGFLGNDGGPCDPAAGSRK